MRAAVRAFLRIARRVRFLRWATTARIRLRWHGIRLELRSAGDTILASTPSIDVHRTRVGAGVFRLEIAEGVRVGREVEIDLHTGHLNELVLGRNAAVSSGVRFKLRGGRIEIGDSTVVRDFATVKSSGALRLAGANTLSYGSVIHCEESITLELGTVVAEHVSVLDSDHQFGGHDHPADALIVSEPVVLGERTSILAGSVVLKGTRTGAGCVAAAGSVLRGEYPPASLLAGVPATVVRSLADRRIAGALEGRPPGPADPIAQRATD